MPKLIASVDNRPKYAVDAAQLVVKGSGKHARVTIQRGPDETVAAFNERLEYSANLMAQQHAGETGWAQVEVEEIRERDKPKKPVETPIP